ncbi:MAG: LicD family protein [Lachnospiraceae bacterium]|nr:LicD family protein [Lachnospiraceae bacterium]
MTDLSLEFPEDFFREEIRNGYNVSEKMKKVWAVELDLLNKLLDVCQKYELKCFVDAGTLLGVIRHKGFIPWDDDIDVVMFREDYEKLRAIAQEEFKEPYFFQCAYSDNNYIMGHAQIRNSNTTALLHREVWRKVDRNYGIFIDIFILDGVFQNRFLLKLQNLIVRFCKEGITVLVTKNELLTRRQILEKKFLEKLKLNRIKLSEIMDAALMKSAVEHCEMVAPLGFIHETVKRIRNKHLYDKTVWMDFECMKVPVPGGYHEFLSNRYGDYLKPVQVSTTHGEVYFDPEKSYKEYLEDMKVGKLDYLLEDCHGKQ